jgi:hypothetical protein
MKKSHILCSASGHTRRATQPQTKEKSAWHHASPPRGILFSLADISGNYNCSWKVSATASFFHTWKGRTNDLIQHFQLKIQFQTTPVQINTASEMLEWRGLIAASFDFLDQSKNEKTHILFLHPDVPGGRPDLRRKRRVFGMQHHPVEYSRIVPISSGVAIFFRILSVTASLFWKFKNRQIICSGIFQMKFEFQTTAAEINTSARILEWLRLIPVWFVFLGQSKHAKS